MGDYPGLSEWAVSTTSVLVGGESAQKKRLRDQKAEIVATWTQAKECQPSTEAKSVEQEIFSPLEPPEGTGPDNTLTLAQGSSFWTPGLQSCKRTQRC